MRLVRGWFPFFFVMSFVQVACGPKKRDVSPKLPPASKPATPGAADPAVAGDRVTFALSRPLSGDRIVRMFDVLAMKLVSMETQTDGPDWKALVSAGTGLELRDICRRKGFVSVLVDKSTEEELAPTGRGIVFSLSGPEDDSGCDQGKEYCTISIVAGEGGRYHLRVAELALQEGPFLEEVVSDQVLDKTTWAAVLNFTPREDCLDGDGPRTDDDEAAPTPVVTMTQVVFSHRGVLKVVHEGVQAIRDPTGESTLESQVRVHRVSGKDPHRGFNLLTVVETRNPGNQEATSCAKIDENGDLIELDAGERAALEADPDLADYTCTNFLSR